METQESKLVDGLTVIGMDPSSFRNCGWAVFRYSAADDKVNLVAKFTQEFHYDQNDPARLRDVYNKLSEMIAEHKASILAVERSMGGGNAFIRNNLSETVGVARMCCFDKGITVYEISPSHLKLIIAGYGKARKTHIKKNIAGFFGLKKPGPEHECDASACALTHLVDWGWKGYSVKVQAAPLPKLKTGKKSKGESNGNV